MNFTPEQVTRILAVHVLLASRDGIGLTYYAAGCKFIREATESGDMIDTQAKQAKAELDAAHERAKAEWHARVYGCSGPFCDGCDCKEKAA